MPTLFTIGHSNHPIERFLDLLHRHGVAAVADVRSAPYSRFNPQFKRETLKAALGAADISYVYLGRELGGRTDDPDLLENGQVRYDRLAATDRFRSGLMQVRDGAERYSIALMCAEKDPLQCHRTILISRHLSQAGADIRHILANGSIETHEAAITRLMRLHRLADHDLLASRSDLVAEAYDRQAKRIAYAKLPVGREGV